MAHAAPSPAPGTNRIAVTSLVGGLVAVALLVLWLAPLRSDPITVTFSRGTVTVVDAEGNRTDVTPGSVLTAGQRIEVSGAGGATLELPDGHTVTVGDSTALEVLGNRGNLLGTNRSIELDVEGGRVRVTGEGRDGATLDLSTPVGVAGVRGTTLVVEVAGAQALLSLQQGAVDIAGASERVSLAQGTGAVVTASGVDVQPLPAAPALVSPATGALVTQASTPVTWSGVPGAAAYGVEFSRTVDFTEIVHRVVVADTAVAVPTLDEDMPVYVRVSARSASGLEGAPSDERLLHVRLRFGQGQALQAAERFEESIAEFLAALPNYDTDPRLLKDLAWSLYVAERLDESRTYYERALVEAPGDTEALLEVGRVLFWLEDYDAAAAAYRQVLDDAPNDADALWGLGDTYRVMGRTADAEALLLRALQVEPGHAYAPESLRRLREGG